MIYTIYCKKKKEIPSGIPPTFVEWRSTCAASQHLNLGFIFGFPPFDLFMRMLHILFLSVLAFKKNKKDPGLTPLQHFLSFLCGGNRIDWYVIIRLSTACDGMGLRIFRMMRLLVYMPMYANMPCIYGVVPTRVLLRLLYFSF